MQFSNQIRFHHCVAAAANLFVPCQLSSGFSKQLCAADENRAEAVLWDTKSGVAFHNSFCMVPVASAIKLSKKVVEITAQCKFSISVKVLSGHPVSKHFTGAKPVELSVTGRRGEMAEAAVSVIEMIAPTGPPDCDGIQLNRSCFPASEHCCMLSASPCFTSSHKENH